MSKNSPKEIYLFLVVILSISCVSSVGNARQDDEMADAEYRQRLNSQIRYHPLLSAGDRSK